MTELTSKRMQKPYSYETKNLIQKKIQNVFVNIGDENDITEVVNYMIEELPILYKYNNFTNLSIY